MKNDVDFFKLLGDRNRLRIALLLAEGELFVCQLTTVLELSQPLVSKNLRQFERAGVAQSLHRGKLVFYRLADDLPNHQMAILQATRTAVKARDPFRSDMNNLRLMQECMRRMGGESPCAMPALRQFLIARTRQSPSKEKTWNT